MFKPFYLLTILALTLFTSLSQNVSASVKVQSLQVEYTKTPLGIDVRMPRFTWQMSVSEGDRIYSQSAYQLVVINPEGKVMWDSKKTTDGKSLNIQYAGSPLKPTTKYNWTVTVWDQKGASSSGSSWFETGLMSLDPALSAWDGATWIGGS